MKTTMINFILIALISSFAFSACVSQKKFAASEAAVIQLKKDNADVKNQLNECGSMVKNLNNDKLSLLNDNLMVSSDLKALSVASDLTISDQTKRLRNFQNMVQAQKELMTKLKSSIADALMNYNSDELSVDTRDGKVYISLEEKLLFKSGSDIVDPKGKEALKSLANVLNSTNDITVQIEGHTDNMPIKTKQFKDNWALSTARANSIVRILTEDYKFDSNRITTSGCSSYDPVQTNETAAGRASNRRTEIIVQPNLTELYKMLE